MIETLRTVLAAGGTHLGDLLWWTLSDAAIDRTNLEAHWASANLPRSCYRRPPPPRRR